MDSEVVNRVEKIIELTDGKICHHCLGRKISDILPGDGNVDRSLKVIEELDLELNDEDCVICKNTFSKINDDLFQKINDKINFLEIEFDTFLVGTRIDKEILNIDEEFNKNLNIEVEPIKKEFNREIGKVIENSLDKEVVFDKQDIVINVDLRKESKVRIQINPIFIEGKYNKLIRGIPQTKWPCRKCKGRGCEECNFTGKQYPESVEELISETFLKVTKGYDAKFHGAGREDIDVLMLGSGRPFVLEIKEPRIRKLDLKTLENEVNELNKGKTQYHDLKFVERNRKAELKVSSPNTFKVYQALVKCDEEFDINKLNDLKSLDEINQQTPLRVLHRRADKIRVRHVIDLETEVLDSKSFLMTIKTEGGLYIKELISGDEGRTQPNISSILGVKGVCQQLDVIEVNKD